MSASPKDQQQPDPHRWWTLFAVCIATFMLLLDVTIVTSSSSMNVATHTAPSVHQRCGSGEVSWGRLMIASELPAAPDGKRR